MAARKNNVLIRRIDQLMCKHKPRLYTPLTLNLTCKYCYEPIIEADTPKNDKIKSRILPIATFCASMFKIFNFDIFWCIAIALIAYFILFYVTSYFISFVDETDDNAIISKFKRSYTFDKEKSEFFCSVCNKQTKLKRKYSVLIGNICVSIYFALLFPIAGFIKSKQLDSVLNNALMVILAVALVFLFILAEDILLYWFRKKHNKPDSIEKYYYTYHDIALHSEYEKQQNARLYQSTF